MKPRPPLAPRLWLDLAAMAAAVAWGLIVHWPGLAHDSLNQFDESFHQVVARHVYDNPLYPALYVDPVHDTPDMYVNYWQVRVWLVKPPAGYWFTALLMAVVGKVPLAYRLGGLLALLGTALTVYGLARRYTGRFAAFLAALALLTLPHGWTFVQGRFISDVLDVGLGGLMCLATLALFRAIEQRSTAWAVVAGAMTGVAILQKFVLALTPLGVAFVLWVLALAQFSRGPTARQLLVMGVAAIAVALPWNVYAALKWPHAYYEGTAAEVLAHLTSGQAAVKAPQWIRPPDTIANEVVKVMSAPIFGAVTILAGVWLAVRAWRSRDYVLLGLAAWLWASWLGHSLPAVKQSSHLWNVAVPQFIALALLARDAFTRWPLAMGGLAASATPLLVPHVQWLSWLRTLTPRHYESHQSNLLAGLQLLVIGVVVGVVLSLVLRARLRWLRWSAGLAFAGWLAFTGLREARVEQLRLSAEAQAHFHVAHSKTVGKAIEQLTPQRSLVLLARDRDSRQQFERHNLLFWSNRLVQDGYDVRDYPEHGFHPYLVTSVAEPFEPLPVPPSAWQRAYDLTKPLPGAAPVPEGLTPLGARVGTAEVVGWAHEPSAAGGASRYAFVVRPNGVARAFKVRFVLRDGEQVLTANPHESLLSVQKLSRAAWYVQPLVGPPADEVLELSVLP